MLKSTDDLQRYTLKIKGGNNIKSNKEESNIKINKSTTIKPKKTSYIINKENKNYFHSEDYKHKLKQFERIKIMNNRPKYTLNIKKIKNNKTKSLSPKSCRKKNNDSNNLSLSVSNISKIMSSNKKEEKEPLSEYEKMEMQLHKEQELPKIIPKNFKYFYVNPHKNTLHKSLSCKNTIEKNYSDKESNFMKLKKESNIYTANADYIKNKKMLLYDKYDFDNNIYRPDRIGKFDMSKFIPNKEKKKIGFIYKTTNFRCGHNFNRCKVCDNLIEDENNKQKSNIFIKYDINQRPGKKLSEIPLIDYDFINKNRIGHSDSDLLYRELAIRQYEIYNKFLKNNWDQLNIGYGNP